MRLPARHMAAVVATAALVVSPLALAATPAMADSTTPSGASFGRLFYDGTTVRTVATPTSTPGRGVDDIYAVAGGAPGQLSVTAVAPGDDYHGGRWAVHLVTWNSAPYLLTSDEAVLAAQVAGHITITRVPSADFVCPVAGR